MKHTHLITLISLFSLAVSCTQSTKEVPNEDLSLVEKEEAETPTVIEDEVGEPTEVADIAGVIVESDSLEKIEPIQPMPIVTIFANPLEGLKNRIDLKTIPSEEQIGISAYPNAVIIDVDDRTEYRGKYYVSMELTTSDSVEQVLAYYKKEDAKWSHVEKNGIHTFKKDDSKYFRETNTLQVLPLNKILYEEVDSLLGYEANTLIRIYFEIEPEVTNTTNNEELTYTTPVNG